MNLTYKKSTTVERQLVLADGTMMTTLKSVQVMSV